MKIKFTWILSLIAITFLVSCNSSSASKNDELGKRFFENYSSRKDYKKMLSFYNDSLLYENVTQYSGGSTVDPRYLLNDIIRWSDQTMQYENNKLLKVNELFSNDSMIIASGEFSPYTYHGMKFPAMKFRILSAIFDARLSSILSSSSDRRLRTKSALSISAGRSRLIPMRSRAVCGPRWAVIDFMPLFPASEPPRRVRMVPKSSASSSCMMSVSSGGIL